SLRASLDFFRDLHRVRLGDLGNLQNLGNSSTSKRVEIVAIIAHVLNLQRVEVKTKLQKVWLHVLKQLVRKLEAVLIDLLGSQCGEIAAQISFQGFLSYTHDLFAITSQESLDCGVNHFLITRDLDVRDRVHVEGNTTFGVGTFGVHSHRED